MTVIAVLIFFLPLSKALLIESLMSLNLHCCSLSIYGSAPRMAEIAWLLLYVIDLCTVEITCGDQDCKMNKIKCCIYSFMNYPADLCMRMLSLNAHHFAS